MSTLTVAVGGTEPITIEWYEDDVLMPGETGLTISEPDPTKQYHVVATNACGTTTSAKVFGDGTLA